MEKTNKELLYDYNKLYNTDWEERKKEIDKELKTYKRKFFIFELIESMFWGIKWAFLIIFCHLFLIIFGTQIIKSMSEICPYVK